VTGPIPDENDPFAADDPLEDMGAPLSDESDDFDTLGFDTTFGSQPAAMGSIGDNDETPPGGIYVGEELSILDAQMIGRALAEADGTTEDYTLPDMAVLQRGLIGIDMGAAKAVVARFTADGGHEIVPNDDDDLSTPVQFFFDDDGEQMVGREARDMAPSEPNRAVLDIKKALSDPEFEIEAGGEHGKLAAKDVVSVLIRRLLDDAEEHSSERPTHVSLAAPSWYGDGEREALKQAVEAAGATLVGIADEALAAAVPYSLRLPDLSPRNALIFDLGHAALSVAVVQCKSGDIAVVAQQSKKSLGSSAWESLLCQEAARKFEQAHGHNPLTDDDPSSAMDLQLRAEDAKKALSQRAQFTLVVSSKGNTHKVGFTRRSFEEAAAPLIEGAKKLLIAVRDAAKIDAWKDLDAVIITGGGSRTPAIRRMLLNETGHEFQKGIGPEDGVAVGSLYWGIGERHRQSAT
jgi:molecular chaperone DnaK